MLPQLFQVRAPYCAVRFILYLNTSKILNTPYKNSPASRMQTKKQEWLAKGHGEVREITEKEFFNEMKGVDRMICHFYRSSVPCQIMEKHLLDLAKRHIETKFVKIQAEKAPFLTERLNLWMLPTLAVIKSEKTTDYVVGFDELGGSEDFPPEVLEQRLVAAGAIFEDSVPKGPPPGAEEAVHQRTMRKGGPERTNSDEDSDFD